jgi:tRNA 2-thiouridine synthesizing protein B
MLFIVNKSPFNSKSLDSCLKVAKKGDTILLIEDGVYAVGTHLEKAIKKQIAVYALQADLEARGLKSSIPIVDYSGFVRLVEKDAVVSWM